MSYPQKTMVKLAIPKNSYKHNLSHPVVGTTDYYKLQVSTYIPVPEKNTLVLNQQTMCRAENMKVPPFAKARMLYKLYFVPYHLVDNAFNDMKQNRMHVFDDKPDFVSTYRTFKYSIITQLCLNYAAIYTGTGAYDFIYGSTKYRFRKEGRAMYNILVSLGYKYNKEIATDDITHYLDASPLLCLAKIYLDYYYTNKYDTVLRNYVEKIINTNTFTQRELNLQDVVNIIDLILKQQFYDEDYFVSAFDKPQGLNQGTANSIQYPVLQDTSIEGVQGSEINNQQGTPYIKGNSSISSLPSYFTQYIDSALKKVTQYVQRLRLAGTNTAYRFLARFGYELDSEKNKTAVLVDDFSFDIKYSDIFSTADTSGAGLGQYAGLGFGGYKTQQPLKYYNKEEGMYIMLYCLLPEINYYQGIDHNVLAYGMYDKWTPEFDNLGYEPIAQEELYSPYKEITGTPIGASQSVTLKFGYGKVFGYVPRYTFMKKKLGNITGDFIFESINAGKDAWHLFREINPLNHWERVVNDYYFDAVHSLSFTNASIDREQYDRAFNQKEVDNFTIISLYDIECYNSMKSIYDSYLFDDLDTKEIEIKNQGN